MERYWASNRKLRINFKVQSYIFNTETYLHYIESDCLYNENDIEFIDFV